MRTRGCEFEREFIFFFEFKLHYDRFKLQFTSFEFLSIFGEVSIANGHRDKAPRAKRARNQQSERTHSRVPCTVGTLLRCRLGGMGYMLDMWAVWGGGGGKWWWKRENYVATDWNTTNSQLLKRITKFRMAGEMRPCPTRGSFLFFVHPPVQRSAPVGERNHGHTANRNSLTCRSVWGVAQTRPQTPIRGMHNHRGMPSGRASVNNRHKQAQQGGP